MTQREILERVKERLRELYGARFRGLVLYGSVARGVADADSDIDLLCLLDGPVDMIDETLFITGEIFHLQMEYLEMPISVKAVDIADYKEGSYPLVIEAKKEGIPV